MKRSRRPPFLPEDDLELIIEAAGDDLRLLDGCHVGLTGGTGFVGSWLVDSVCWARMRLGLDIKLTVLTRSRRSHLFRRPDLAEVDGLEFVEGDVRGPLGGLGTPDAVIHAATEASARLNESNPAEMLDVIVAGMSNVLSFAALAGDIPFLFTSSGAVYGRQPLNMSHVSETYAGAPDVMDARSAYHEGKRVAELLATLMSSQSDLRFVSARLFAFLGPLLPLDTHFAAGNFLADCLAGRPITIKGDGSPLRSYMHPVDLTVWLWALLLRGADQRAYNVGSEEPVSIRGLAEVIAAYGNDVSVEVAQEPDPLTVPERYVPSTQRSRTELGLTCSIGLDEAIRRTMQWQRSVLR